MRAAFIVLGIELMRMFSWTTYVLGAILVFTALKLLVKEEGPVEPDKNPVVRLFKKLFPVTDRMDGAKFFTRMDGRWVATPLFIVVLVVETTDVVFAVDSVPAILSISQDTFVVYTSNIFAILGLRSLYFLLARMMHAFRFLKYGLVVILLFVGAKMLAAHHLKVSIGLSLGVIGGTLVLSVLLSLLFREPHKHDPGEEKKPPENGAAAPGDEGRPS
jgi:tellurite resistance protein TerC